MIVGMIMMIIVIVAGNKKDQLFIIGINEFIRMIISGEKGRAMGISRLMGYELVYDPNHHSTHKYIPSLIYISIGYPNIMVIS